MRALTCRRSRPNHPAGVDQLTAGAVVTRSMIFRQQTGLVPRATISVIAQSRTRQSPREQRNNRHLRALRTFLGLVAFLGGTAPAIRKSSADFPALIAEVNCDISAQPAPLLRSPSRILADLYHLEAD